MKWRRKVSTPAILTQFRDELRARGYRVCPKYGNSADGTWLCGGGSANVKLRRMNNLFQELPENSTGYSYLGTHVWKNDLELSSIECLEADPGICRSGEIEILMLRIPTTLHPGAPGSELNDPQRLQESIQIYRLLKELHCVLNCDLTWAETYKGFQGLEFSAYHCNVAFWFATAGPSKLNKPFEEMRPPTQQEIEDRDPWTQQPCFIELVGPQRLKA